MLDARSRDLYEKQMSAIRELRNCAAFSSYWLVRLKQKADVIEARFRNDEPDKCSHEEREILRRILKEYQGIFDLLDSDEGVARKQLS